MTKEFLLVFIGGGAGSMCRYALSRFLVGYTANTSFPWATFLANILGCFFIGLLLASFAKGQAISKATSLMLATGFCGGFTTFSTFAYENNLLFKNQEYGLMLLYTSISVVVGFSVTFLAIYLVNKLG